MEFELNHFAFFIMLLSGFPFAPEKAATFQSTNYGGVEMQIKSKLEDDATANCAFNVFKTSLV